MKRIINLILKLTLISTFFLSLNAKESVYSKVSQYHLNSFKPKINREDLLNSLDLATGEVNKAKLGQIIKKKFTEPRKYTEIILNLFDYSEKNKPTDPKLAQTSNKLFENLEVLCGEHTASSHLLSKIDRTRSFAGRSTLARMLIEPTTDTNELKKRQNIIKELVENQETFDQLNIILDNYSLSEKEFLNFFKEKTFNKLFGSENYFPHMFWVFSLMLDVLPKSVVDSLEVDKLSDKVNKNNLLVTVFNLLASTSKVFSAKTLINEGIKRDYSTAIEEIRKNKTKSALLLPLQILFGFSGTKFQITRIADSVRNIYFQIKQEKKNYKLLKSAYKKLQRISSIVSNLEEIKKTIDNNENLKDKISSFEQVEYLFENKPSKSHLFDVVLKNLKTETFKAKETPFLRLLLLKGKVLSTAYLLAKTQMHLVGFIKSIGQVDAYMSIAKLYKESSNKEVKYCFTEYETNDVPDTSVSHINMEQFWTPFIDQKTVITNDIELGGTKVTKCALISGPNAGGKSTILKSIILNTLLSQTITIAAANKCSITPFSYIDTYLNITDNISGGNSLFKSEVLRVKNMLKNIKKNGKSLIIVDEMFSGTNPKEGGASGYAIAEYIAQLASDKEQIIALMASHYPEMTELEENTLGIFKNYKVTVNTEKSSHKLVYPFKLQEGKSNQAIAIDILQAEGLDQKIIDSARKIASRNDLYAGV